jgi:hypothetical protein
VRTGFPDFSVGCDLVWHERTHGDPGSTCFRSVLAEALGAAAPSA